MMLWNEKKKLSDRKTSSSIFRQETGLVVPRFNNWLDDTKDISEQIKSTTTQMFDGMTDALGDFVTTGKANFRSFATSVISDLSRIALKASITGIFDSISNSSSGGF